MRFEKQWNMQASNTNKPGRPDDPVWQFLVEYPLSEFLPDHDQGCEFMAGLLSQTEREWDIPLEYLENIEMTLTGFVKEALARSKQGKLALPGRIRVYCQKKIIGDANSTRANSRPYHAEQSVDHLQKIYQSTAKMGGWGYFLIEKGWIVPVDSLEGSWNTIDLYLYKEGK